MPHSKMASFLDMITLFLATFSAIAGGIMCWLIYANPSARVLIKRGNGGKHIRAIIFGILFSGLSSLPYLAFSLNFQSQICPFKWIHLFACLRVFSLRFEISQMLFLSIDRLIISLEMNTNRCRLLRRRLFRPFQCASFLIATVDLFMFIRGDQTWPSYSLDCILMFTSNSVFIHWHFFLMNFLALALTLALLLAQHIYQPDQLLNSSIRKRMSRLSNRWLIVFCMGLGTIFLLELANRFWPTFDANKLLRNYMDTIFQLLHLIYLPIFLRSVPWKSNGKIHTTASIQTIDLNLTRGGQTAGGGGDGNDHFS